jgi:leucyl/phenylalanyl-tRNA--protein transferase
MPVIFPPLEQADEHGILAIGGNLDIETLKTAYKSGIFPWPVSNEIPLTWFAPDPRGVLEFKDLHIPRSLKKALKKSSFHVVFNRNFDQVIQMCADVKRKNEQGTWINQDILAGYQIMFKHKFAYSVEVYDQEQLVGGLYGVCLGEIISGESMFHLKPNASKLALLSLIEQLSSKGVKWIDTQMVTPVIKSFGGKEITRAQFMQNLSQLNPHRSRFELFGS